MKNDMSEYVKAVGVATSDVRPDKFLNELTEHLDLYAYQKIFLEKMLKTNGAIGASRKRKLL